MIRVVASVVALGFCVSLASAQSRGETWSAVAYSEKARAYGFSANKPSKRDAESMAMKFCQTSAKGKGGCAVTVSTSARVAVNVCLEKGYVTSIMTAEHDTDPAAAATAVIAKASAGKCDGVHRLNW